MTERVQGAGPWFKVTTTVFTPADDTVILATLEIPPGFCEYEAVIEPVPVPPLVTVHQVWLLVAVQLHPDGTVTEYKADPER